METEDYEPQCVRYAISSFPDLLIWIVFHSNTAGTNHYTEGCSASPFTSKWRNYCCCCVKKLFFFKNGKFCKCTQQIYEFTSRGSKDLSRKEKLSVFWFILTYAHEVVTERIRLWIQGESPGCLSSPVETEWGALFVQEGPKGLQLLCIKKATWDVYDAFWTTHRWSVSSVSILEETLKQTQVTQERVFLSTRLVTPQYPPKTARGGSWGEGDLSSTV